MTAATMHWFRNFSLVTMLGCVITACGGKSVRQSDDSLGGGSDPTACKSTLDCTLVSADAAVPDPWIFAACLAGHCIAVDARETELTECSDMSDCRLRAGLACCKACRVTRESIVAVSTSVDLIPWLCGSESIFCDACAPELPQDLAATCENGRCAVQAVSPPD